MEKEKEKKKKKKEKIYIGEKDKGYYYYEEEKTMLGKGSFGVVFTCYNENRKGEMYAAKEVITDNGSDAETYLESEIKILDRISELEIPNVIKKVHATSPKALPDGKKSMRTIIFEMCSGKSLERLIEESAPFSEEDICYILRPLLKCLKGLHNDKIVHRDLKPANILFKKEWSSGNPTELRLTDFGVATKIARGLSDGMSAVGTMAYMAPEQIQMLSYQPATDMYAFGVILYQMLFRFLPFADQTAVRTWFQKNPPCVVMPRCRPVSVECFDVLQSCMRIDPSCRYSAKQLLKHRFFKAKREKDWSLHMFEEVFDGSLNSLFYRLDGVAPDYSEMWEHSKEEDEDPIFKSNERFVYNAQHDSN
ncbi:MAG: serine/threonine-protein kinase [Candidatus Pacebacteria bacterium]|nr:serine/threonine-protein kinase [Candidatus Paceibacterota bacterium]